MATLTLNAAQRSELRALAHPIKPVIIIGDAGLTDAVLKETELALSVHSLIKVRVAGDDRQAREAYLAKICSTLNAAPVQHIGKLLVIYRPDPTRPIEPRAVAKKALTGRATTKKLALAEKAAKTPTKAPRRNPVSGRTSAPRKVSKASARKITAATHPPRTDRVRKSGQRSAKKAFQSN